MTNSERVKLIEKRLQTALNPIKLLIRDDSDLHAGHLSAKASGGGHFSVTLVSVDFQSKSMVQRHKMVYEALDGLMGETIHAIQIQAKTPEEYK